MVLISFEHLQTIQIFGNLEGVAEKLDLPSPFQFYATKGHGKLIL